MKRKLWAVADPGLGVVVALATLAAWPLLSRASLPTLTDAHHHIYRTYEILAAWHAGIAYPRWAPDFYYGFGYPVLNYYSTLTYYLAAAYGWFFGPVAGVKFVLVLSAYLGAVGVYLFGRDQWDPPASVLAAAVFAFSPYIVLIDPIQRGALPETFAIALAPLVLWSFTRLARTGSAGYFILSAGLLAALVVAHNLMSFVFIGVLGGWLLWDLLLIHRPGGAAAYARVLSLLAGAGLLALALTAYMWLPAALESDAVQFQKAFVAVQPNRYQSLSELFAPVSTAVVQAFVPAEFHYRLGWPQWLLALAGGLAVLRPSPHRRATVFFGLVAVACLWVMVPQSSWLWDHVSLLPFLQFSFRLLGVTSLCLAWLAGAALEWAAHARLKIGRNGLAVLLTSGVVVAGLPLLNPLPWPNFGPVNASAILDLDLYGLWGVGTTWDGEFLPSTVLLKPQPVPSVSDAIVAGSTDKVDRQSLPPGAVVEQIRHDFTRDEFNVTSPASIALRLYTFDWPGWTAYVDGAPTPIQASGPNGWILLSVPTGTHVVVVQLEDTGPRRLGWVVSGAGLLVVLAVAGTGWTRRRTAWGAPTAAASRLPARPALLLGSILILAIVARAGLDLELRWQAAYTVPPVAEAQVQQSVRFDDGMALVAFSLPTSMAKPGGKVPLTVYLRAAQHIDEPASVFVHLYGPNGQLWGQADLPDPVLFYPTTRWALGEPKRSDLTLAIKPDAPRGSYTLALGLWNRATGVRSHPLDQSGRPSAQDKVILSDHFQVQP